MVSEAKAAYSIAVGSSPNGSRTLAGPYPLDVVGTLLPDVFLVVLFRFLP